MRQAYDYWQDQPGSYPSPAWRWLRQLPGSKASIGFPRNASHNIRKRMGVFRVCLAQQPESHCGLTCCWLSSIPLRPSFQSEPTYRKANGKHRSAHAKHTFRRPDRRASLHTAVSRPSERPSHAMVGLTYLLRIRLHIVYWYKFLYGCCIKPFGKSS